MEWFRRASGSPSRLGILAGSFNPPTVAHLALARTAIGMVDEVVFVLPRVFPHKPYVGASFEERIALLCRAVADETAMSVAASDGGLLIDIARECRQARGPDVRLSFLCGRDAAERIVGWDYGEPGAFEAMLDHFDLLVASRAGSYVAPPGYAGRIRELPMADPLDDVSSSAVRERIGRGEPWEFLAPASIAGEIRRIYGER
jgi:nicotinate (nicotinamide) nucleotide adenylyltransferase